MADNTVLNAGVGGDTIASDDVVGIKYQYVKLADGTADSATPIPGGAAGLLVDLGANNDVSVTGSVSVSGSALPAGAATSALQTQPGVDIGDVTVNNAAGAAAVNIQDGGNIITVDGTVAVTNAALSVVGGGVELTALRVTVANDSTGLLSVDDNGASLSVDWNGTQPVTGSGTATGALRVELANNGTGLLATVSTVTNLSQQGGVAISLNTGVRDTGTQRVTIATNDLVPVSLAAETTKVIGTARVIGNAGAIFDGATGAAVPANIILEGLRAATANPTNATGGNSVAAMGDKAGRMVITAGNVRELVGVQTTNIVNSVAETTVVTAGGANVFNDLSCLNITNRTATAVNVTLKDATAGTTRAIYDLAASGGIVIPFPVPMPQAAANANWTVTLSVNTVTVDINVVFLKNL